MHGDKIVCIACNKGFYVLLKRARYALHQKIKER